MVVAAAKPVFYRLPVEHLTEGMSTADGQDVLDVFPTETGQVIFTVFTPRPDDPARDAYNRTVPEARMRPVGSLVEMADFPDTATRGAGRPGAVPSPAV